MNDVRPFEEYKEMIKDMGKEEMIRGLYDLSARVTKQENIIKEVREYIEKEVKVYYVLDTKLNEVFDKTNKVKEDILDILNKEKDNNEQ